MAAMRYVWSPTPGPRREGSGRPKGSAKDEEDVDFLADDDDSPPRDQDSDVFRADEDSYSCSRSPEYDRDNESRSELRSSSPEPDRDDGRKEAREPAPPWPRSVKDFPIQPNKVYLAGIPRSVTEEQLEDYFKRYGRVTLIDLKRTAGLRNAFGFASFQDPQEVRAVLKDRDRHRIRGERFDVQACGTFGMRRSGPTEIHRVFVQGIPRGADEQQVSDYFSKFGEVTEVHLVDEEDVAFVTFKSGAAVQLALHAYNDHTIAGKWVQVQPMIRKVRGRRYEGDEGGRRHRSDYSDHGPGTSSSSTGAKPKPALEAPWRQGGATGRHEGPRNSAFLPEDLVVERNKIFVGGLAPRGTSAAVEEEDLFEYFEFYGKITKITMKVGFAFVEFASEHPVGKILEHYDNHEVKGQWIECRAFGRFGLDPGLPTHKKQIFVGGLHKKNVTVEDMEDYFSQYGTIDFVQLKDGGGSAVVAFKSGSGAQLLLWSSHIDQLLNGNLLEIRPCPIAKGEKGGGKGHSSWSNDDSGASKGDWGGGKGKRSWSSDDSGASKGDWGGGKGKRSWRDDDSGASSARPALTDWGSQKRSRPWEADHSTHQYDAPWKDRKVEQPRGYEGGLAALVEPEKIFVTGLPVLMNDDEIAEYFGKYGVVKDLSIKRDDSGFCKGFGFVTLASEKQVRAVLMDYDEHRFGGKYIECMACGKFGMAVRAPLDKKRIFVGGTSGMASESLEWHFSQFGAVDTVEMEKRHAIVTFRSGAGTQLALHAYHNHSIEGRQVEVRPSLLMDGKSSDGGQQNNAQPHGWHQDKQSWGGGAGYSSGQWWSRSY